MHAYEHQESLQTLAAGIAEYHGAHPDLAQGRKLSPAAAAFFRCHDAVHVVYGCSNTLDDEAIVKISSMLGSTAGLGVLRGYTLHEAFDIYKSLAVSAVLRSILHAMVLIPHTVIRCLRQTRRWPWNDFDHLLQVPLRDLRTEFGIRVAHDRPGDMAS